MSDAGAVLDVRGEMCPMPSLRVEQFLKTHASNEPFSVLGDHLPTLESLELLAMRYGWNVAFEQAADGNWRAGFTRA
jgi:TusA-related sulfurtransferase